MAGFNILKWLYKHSPVNFYSITDNGETIIKSINNTSVGYKYSQEFDKNTIEKRPHALIFCFRHLKKQDKTNKNI